MHSHICYAIQVVDRAHGIVTVSFGENRAYDTLPRRRCTVTNCTVVAPGIFSFFFFLSRFIRSTKSGSCDTWNDEFTLWLGLGGDVARRPHEGVVGGTHSADLYGTSTRVYGVVVRLYTWQYLVGCFLCRKSILSRVEKFKVKMYGDPQLWSFPHFYKLFIYSR